MGEPVLTEADILRVATEWQTRACTQTIVLNSEILDYSRMLLAAAEPVIRADERERCANVCEQEASNLYELLAPERFVVAPALRDAAQAIRSLGAGSKGDTDVHVR